MSENNHGVAGDVAFLRALADGSTSGAAKEGAILVAIGLIFGLVAAQYWAIDSGLLQVSPAVNAWLWLDGLVPFVVVVAVIRAKFPSRSPGIASRAIAAAWAGMGTALLVAELGLVAASHELGIPLLTKWMFPLVLFTLIGAAWGVVFAVRRKQVTGLAALGSFAAAIGCGAVMGQPAEWLALSAGLLLLVALPGGIIVRSGR